MADLNSIVEQLSALTVLEAAELAKMLDEKWGVSAAAAVAGFSAGAPATKGFGFTVAPGRTFWVPSAITCSPRLNMVVKNA